jgi:hypothetical protein
MLDILDNDLLLDADECAAKLALAPRTWHRWRKLNQTPPAIFIGRKPYWRLSALQRHLLGLETAA